MSNFKYVSLSSQDQFNSKYFGTINKFVLPASITFNTTETVNKIYDKEYIISVPAVDSRQIEFDKAILVFRLDMMKIGAIFVTIRNIPHPLLVRTTCNYIVYNIWYLRIISFIYINNIKITV